MIRLIEASGIKLLLLFLTLSLCASCGIDASGTSDDHPAKDSNIVTVSNGKELLAAISSNTHIQLLPGTYDLTMNDRPDSNTHVTVVECCPGIAPMRGVIIRDISNLKITGGKDVEIHVSDMGFTVFNFVHCSGIQLEGLELGHKPKTDTLSMCTGGVLFLDSCKKITINNCDMFGSGLFGIEIRNVEGVTCTNSTIRECTSSIVGANESNNLAFKNCIFKNNLGREQFIGVSRCNNVTFEGCTLEGNRKSGSPFESYDHALFAVGKIKDLKIVGSIVKGNRTQFFLSGSQLANAVIDSAGIYEQNFFKGSKK